MKKFLIILSCCALFLQCKKVKENFLIKGDWVVEACYMNTPIISSNCKNGPEEILNHGKNGLLFDNNNKKSLLEALKRFENLTEKELKQFKINAKKESKKFTMFNHYKLLIQILKIYE